jgi:1-acyl-sn-glycerol-3-phosphate acyltransferase
MYPLYVFCKITVRWILYIFFGLRISGAEYIPRSGALILAANHVSNFDPPVLGAVLSRRLNFVAKEELFRNRIFGAFLRQLGAFPLRRGGADAASIKVAVSRLRKDQAVLIFPQGTRTVAKGSRVRAGVGFLAAKTGAVVIPARIIGTDVILPRGVKYPRCGTVRVVFGKPLRIENSESYEDFSERVLGEIFNLC